MGLPSLDISAYGGVGDGVTDNTPALNAVVAAAYSQNIRYITFGLGRFAFNTPPAPITSGMHILGTNRPETMLIRNYSSSVSPFFLQWEGGQVYPPNVYGGTGGGIKDLHIIAATGTTGGIGLYPNAKGAQPNGSMFLIENIEIYAEGTGWWQYALYVDGSANQTNPSWGIRDVLVSRCDFMYARTSGIYMNNAVACYLRDVGVYGGGNGGVPDIYVYGVTASAPNTSTYININGASVNGKLHLINCSNVVANGIFGGGVVASGTTNCLVNAVSY